MVIMKKKKNMEMAFYTDLESYSLPPVKSKFLKIKAIRLKKNSSLNLILQILLNLNICLYSKL